MAPVAFTLLFPHEIPAANPTAHFRDPVLQPGRLSLFLDTGPSSLKYQEKHFLHQYLPYLGISMATVYPWQNVSEKFGPDHCGAAEWDRGWRRPQARGNEGF